MESLPIPGGYGVELAVLLDTAARCGLEAVAQGWKSRLRGTATNRAPTWP